MEISSINKKKLDAVFRKHHVQVAYVFGSVAGGYATADSDIDIAVVLPDKMSKEKRLDARLGLMSALAPVFKRSVDAVVLNDISSLFFKYVIVKEGKLIYRVSDDKQIDLENNILSFYLDFQPFLNSYNRHYVKSGL